MGHAGAGSPTTRTATVRIRQIRGLKKYFAYAFILTGMMIAVVSCAPVIRIPVTGATIETFGRFSFLGAAMLLAFASLATLIGVLMVAKTNPLPPRAEDERPVTRMPATLLNLSPLVLFAGIPMAHLLIPLWIMRRAREPALANEAARVLDFQITWTLFAVVGLILCMVLVGVFLLAVLLGMQLIVSLRAARHTWLGRQSHFPMSLVLVSRENRDAGSSG